MWCFFLVFMFFCGVLTDYTVYTWCTVVVVIACNSSWSCSKTAYLLVCSFCLCMCLLCLFVRGIIYFYGTIMATANERIAPGSSQSSFKRGIFFIRVYVVWFFWCEFTIFLVCIYSRRSITGISLRLLILQNTLTATTVNKLITNEHEMMMQWLQSSCTYRAWNLTYCCYRTYTVPYYNALLSLLLNLMFFLTIHTNFDFFLVFYKLTFCNG